MGALTTSSVKMSRPSPYLNLSNRFEVLSDKNIQNTNSTTSDDQMEATTSNAPQVQNSASLLNTPKTKVPPIVVGGQFYDQLIHKLKHHNINNYTLKLTSVGIRLNITFLNQYKLILNTLKSPSHGMSYYTHDASDAPQKFVLEGLFTQENNDKILRSLGEHNLKPIDIKLMTIKTHTFQNQGNFDKNTTKLNDLQKVKYICNVVVLWQHYRSRSGPTQCHNCQMFGHGSRNCTLAPRCVKCGGNHKTNTSTSTASRTTRST